MTERNVAARDLQVDDVLAGGGTITSMNDTANPGVVYVEIDWQFIKVFNHGDPVMLWKQGDTS